jgi:hypothetical protein
MSFFSRAAAARRRRPFVGLGEQYGDVDDTDDQAKKMAMKI